MGLSDHQMLSPQRVDTYHEQFRKIVWTLDTFWADMSRPAPPGRPPIRCSSSTDHSRLLQALCRLYGVQNSSLP